MTTARNVIAKAICWGTQGQGKCDCGDGSDCAYYTDADAVLSALLSASDSVRSELAALLCPWRPIETAPKDRTPVLLKLKNPIPEPDRDDLRQFDGLYFVGACIGDCWQWYFAAPVGQGGFPDDWFEGWQPLPAPPKEDK